MQQLLGTFPTSRVDSASAAALNSFSPPARRVDSLTPPPRSTHSPTEGADRGGGGGGGGPSPLSASAPFSVSMSPCPASTNRFKRPRLSTTTASGRSLHFESMTPVKSSPADQPVSGTASSEQEGAKTNGPACAQLAGEGTSLPAKQTCKSKQPSSLTSQFGTDVSTSSPITCSTLPDADQGSDTEPEEF